MLFKEAKPKAKSLLRFALLLGLAIGSYALWCARPFLLRPVMIPIGTFPESARELVMETLFHTQEFSFAKWADHLCHPTKFNGLPRNGRAPEVKFQQLSGDRFTATIPYECQWEFGRNGAEWQVIRASPLKSIHPPAPQNP